MSASPTRPHRGVARRVLRGVGELLITLGVVVLLFVVYEVYVTDLFGERKQARRPPRWTGCGRRPRRPPRSSRRRPIGGDRCGAERSARAGAAVRHGRRRGFRQAPHPGARAPTTCSPSSRAPTPTTCTSVPGTTRDPVARRAGQLRGGRAPRVQGVAVQRSRPAELLRRGRRGDPGRLVRLPGAADGRARRRPGRARHARTVPACRCRPARTRACTAGRSRCPPTTRRCCPIPTVLSTSVPPGRPAADHPDDLSPAVLRRRADDHPRRAGDAATPRRRASCPRTHRDLTGRPDVRMDLAAPARTDRRPGRVVPAAVPGHGRAAVLRRSSPGWSRICRSTRSPPADERGLPSGSSVTVPDPRDDRARAGSRLSYRPGLGAVRRWSA